MESRGFWQHDSMYLSLMIGLLTGALVTIFMAILGIAQFYLIEYPWMIYFLPLAAILLIFINHFAKIPHYFGVKNDLHQLYRYSDSFNLDFPRFRAVFLAIQTFLGQIVGASTGREGVAVQLGIYAVKWIPEKWRAQQNTRLLFISGAAAGFSAAIGAPLAAVFFVIELFRRQESIRKLFFYGLSSSIVAFVCTQILQVKHTQLPHLPFYRFQFKEVNYIIFCLFCFALLARIFKWLLSQSEFRLSQMIPNDNKRLFLLSFVYLGFILLLPGQQWIGLGTVWIEKYFLVPSVGYLFLIKLLATIFCLSIGFRGGEFVPLLFIGATMGNYFAQQFNLPISLMAALGFVAVYSGTSRLMVTSLFLAIELFGWEISGWAFLAILMSFIFSGKDSIYRSYSNGQK